MPAEAKVDKVTAKCRPINASLSLTWQGHIIIVDGQTVVILNNDVQLIYYAPNISNIIENDENGDIFKISDTRMSASQATKL